MISESLELASFGAGDIVLFRRPHDARALVHQVTKAFETAAMVKKLAISAGCPERSVTGNFDPDRIAQVLTHLIGNTVKFTAAGGRISVNVASQGTDLCFSVHDTGIGVPAERIQTIFDRSAQLSGSGRREGGLGLYIARRLVEAHRGRNLGREPTPRQHVLLLPARVGQRIVILTGNVVGRLRVRAKSRALGTGRDETREVRRLGSAAPYGSVGLGARHGCRWPG